MEMGCLSFCQYTKFQTIGRLSIEFIADHLNSNGKLRFRI